MISSQVDAAVWISKMDVENVDFVENQGRVVHLPRSTTCEKVRGFDATGGEG